MFLYPLAITLILLSVYGKAFNYSKTVYVWTTVFALVSAVCDLINALPEEAAVLNLGWLSGFAAKYIPFYTIGLGWIVPSLIGFVIGMIRYKIKKN